MQRALMGREVDQTAARSAADELDQLGSRLRGNDGEMLAAVTFGVALLDVVLVLSPRGRRVLRIDDSDSAAGAGGDNSHVGHGHSSSVMSNSQHGQISTKGGLPTGSVVLLVRPQNGKPTDPNEPGGAIQARFR